MRRSRWQFPFLPSTRAFFAEGRRTRGYSLGDWLHGYVYARWPYLYIGIGTGEHPWAPAVKRVIGWIGWLTDGSSRVNENSGALDFADTYHGKVVTLESAKKLVMVEQAIELRDLEHVVPYALARDIVMENPDHIVVLECPCRASRTAPCLPLDVCLIVGEPFASFVAEHHGRRARWVTSDEAAEILRAEHQRGHVQHAFFKDAMLGRFYAICNCCSCCCGAMEAHRNGVPMLAASGYLSLIDEALCAGCGDCAAVCPFGAIAVVDGAASVNADLCMGCGICVDQCRQGALSLVRDESKGVPLELDQLMEACLAEVVD